MCELMAMCFETPVSADFSIREFAARGEENADGWGLGWYPDRSLALVKEPIKWRESRYAGFLETYPRLQSPIFLAHVRHRTRGGEPTHADTHPFAREWGGRDYAFAHNGTLDDRVWSLPLGPSRPLGATDSEYAFCHLLREIAGRGDHLDGVEDWRWLYAKLAELNRLGKLNVLLSDGHRLFCYHDTGGWKGLNFRSLRVRDHQTRHFGDASLAIDVEAESGNHGFVVATQPLSAHGWHSFRTGELIVFERGSICFSSHRNRRASEFLPGPRGGQLGPAIVVEPAESGRAGAHDEDHALV